MDISTEVRDGRIVMDYAYAVWLTAVDPDDSKLRRSIAVCEAKEAGVQDFQDDLHEPPRVFRRYPELFDSWLLGNASLAIAAACHELLDMKRQRSAVACADFSAESGDQCGRNQ